MRYAAVILRREFHLEGRAGSVLWSPHWMCHALLLGGVPDAVQLNPKTTTVPQPPDTPLLPVSPFSMRCIFFFLTIHSAVHFFQDDHSASVHYAAAEGFVCAKIFNVWRIQKKKTVLSLSLFMIYIYHEVTKWRNQAGQQHSNALQTLTIFSVYTVHNIITVIGMWNYANEKGSHDSL